MSNQHKDLKSILLAGIIAAGVFAGTFGSTQLLSANAQTTTNQAEQENAAVSTISASGTATIKVQPDKFSDSRR